MDIDILDQFYEEEKKRNEVAKAYEDAAKEYQKIVNGKIDVTLTTHGECDISDYQQIMEAHKEAVTKEILAIAESKKSVAESKLKELLGIATKDANLTQSTSENEKEDEIHLEDKKPLKIENTALEGLTKPELDCSKENLYKLYIAEGRTVKDICAEYDINTQKLYKELGKYGLVDLKKTKRLDAKYRP